MFSNFWDSFFLAQPLSGCFSFICLNVTPKKAQVIS